MEYWVAYKQYNMQLLAGLLVVTLKIYIFNKLS